MLPGHGVLPILVNAERLRSSLSVRVAFSSSKTKLSANQRREKGETRLYRFFVFPVGPFEETNGSISTGASPVDPIRLKNERDSERNRDRRSALGRNSSVARLLIVLVEFSRTFRGLVRALVRAIYEHRRRESRARFGTTRIDTCAIDPQLLPIHTSVLRFATRDCSRHEARLGIVDGQHFIPTRPITTKRGDLFARSDGECFHSLRNIPPLGNLLQRIENRWNTTWTDAALQKLRHGGECRYSRSLPYPAARLYHLLQFKQTFHLLFLSRSTIPSFQKNR